MNGVYTQAFSYHVYNKMKEPLIYLAGELMKSSQLFVCFCYSYDKNIY